MALLFEYQRNGEVIYSTVSSLDDFTLEWFMENIININKFTEKISRMIDKKEICCLSLIKHLHSLNSTELSEKMNTFFRHLLSFYTNYQKNNDLAVDKIID